MRCKDCRTEFSGCYRKYPEKYNYMLKQPIYGPILICLPKSTHKQCLTNRNKLGEESK